MRAAVRPARTAPAAVLATLVAAALSVPSTSWVRVSDSGAVVDPGISQAGDGLRSVVVSGAVGAADLVRRAVAAVGGTTTKTLPIVDGVAATVPADEVDELAHLPGVRAVTLDRAVQLSGSSWDDSTSSSAYPWNSGAAQTWAANGRGSGQISVAVLDTGVSQVNDLAGRVLNGPDLSGEGRNDVDSYGHGTVMAGIIAGSGADSSPSPRTGVAPGVNIVSVKVAGANGSTDVSTVLAGLSWVGAFKDVYGIKVLNLSWGVPSTQDPRVDPLNYAVERLWTSGVVVVVSAGNSGPNAQTILKPGDDPLVLTVGAFDDKADSQLSNDSVPAWSSQGPTAQGVAKPDVVAPGRTIVAARSPGSTVEQQNPKALVGGSYIKGSGTSEAAAVVSGVAALIVSSHGDWTPDQVKAALVSTAVPLGGVSRSVQGAGRVQTQAAMAANPSSVAASSMLSDASGTLQGSRGTSPAVSITCNGATKVLNDETTSWCAPWLGTAWTGTAWTGTAWTGTAWTGTAWTGTAWTGTAWTGTAWTGTAWTGTAWTGTAWTGTAWTSSGWSGTAWTGTAWTGTAWTGTAWTGTAWTSTAWTGATYDDDTAFLSAFWGNHPKAGKHLPGEVSEDKGGHGREKD